MTLDSHPGFCSLVNLSTLGPPLSTVSKFQSAQKVEGLCAKRPNDLPNVTQTFQNLGSKSVNLTYIFWFSEFSLIAWLVIGHRTHLHLLTSFILPGTSLVEGHTPAGLAQNPPLAWC